MLQKNRPDIYLFNPTFEYAVANGNASWQPNKLLQKMENDLSTLPLFLSQPGDVILTNKIPSERFINSLKQINITSRQFIKKDTFTSNKIFIETKKNRLLPWGWSPAAHKLLSPIKNSCSAEFKNSPVFNWHHRQKHLYSRKFSLEILTSLITQFPDNLFISKEYLPKIVTDKPEFKKQIEEWEKIMVKAPWSSSGRGLQPVTKTPVHEKVWEKLLGIVSEQGFAIVEPFLNKEFDLAFQFQLEKRKVTFLGTSHFLTDKKGQYVGNSLNGLPQKVKNDMAEFIELVPGKIIKPLIETIESSELAKNYEGFFGVDTLIFRDRNNRLKINPCLEINVKQTMGLLSLQLEKLVVNNKKGEFKIYYKPGENFMRFAQTMEKKHPLKITNHKIESGFLAITEATETTLFGAYILV